MAQDGPFVPSAIVIPDSLQTTPIPTPTSPFLKRRQSSIAEQDTKRPRLSTDEGSVRSRESPQDDDRKAARRQTGQLEERKRGQRLFGNLLGTLSQSSSSTAQKRRADIERRQQAKLKQQEEEVSQRQHDRREELTAKRRKEQKIFDEKTMRLRHSNMLNQAHFLQTTSEPRLYYKPWDLLPVQEDQIKRQIEDAQARIDEELEAFERRRAEEAAREKEQTTAADTVPEGKMDETIPVGSEPLPEATESHTQKDDGDTNVATSATNGNANAIEGDLSPETEKGDELAAAEAAEPVDEHHGETVVEAAEDTIIY